jgi:hypothetical protein
MARLDPRVIRGMPSGGYGVNGYTGRYQGPGPVMREISIPCPWCRAGAWDDCVTRAPGTQHPMGICYSRILAYNEAHPDAERTV